MSSMDKWGESGGGFMRRIVEIDHHVGRCKWSHLAGEGRHLADRPHARSVAG
jgi:hypothetical protein